MITSTIFVIDSFREWQEGESLFAALKGKCGEGQNFVLKDRIEKKYRKEMIERFYNSCRVLKCFGSFDEFQKKPWSWEIHKKIMDTPLPEWDTFFQKGMS